MRALLILALLLSSPALAQRVEAVRPDSTEAENGTDCTTSNAHTTLDDDPDAPDANWCAASTCGSGSVNTVVDLTMGNPTISPMTSAGSLHVMRAWVRKCGTGGSNPTCRLDAYEDETLRTTGSTDTITSDSGQFVVETFEMSGWTDTTGDLLEVRVVCVTAGTGAAKRTADIGAVEVLVFTDRRVSISHGE